jgi:hypothetical protein
MMCVRVHTYVRTTHAGTLVGRVCPPTNPSGAQRAVKELTAGLPPNPTTYFVHYGVLTARLPVWWDCPRGSPSK